MTPDRQKVKREKTEVKMLGYFNIKRKDQEKGPYEGMRDEEKQGIQE